MTVAEIRLNYGDEVAAWVIGGIKRIETLEQALANYRKDRWGSIGTGSMGHGEPHGRAWVLSAPVDYANYAMQGEAEPWKWAEEVLGG